DLLAAADLSGDDGEERVDDLADCRLALAGLGGDRGDEVALVEGVSHVSSSDSFRDLDASSPVGKSRGRPRGCRPLNRARNYQRSPTFPGVSGLFAQVDLRCWLRVVPLRTRRRGAGTKPTPPSDVNAEAVLPARLGHTGQLATVGHVAEPHTRDAVARQHTTGAAVDGVAAAHADRGGVTGQLLQADTGGLALLVGRVGV